MPGDLKFGAVLFWDGFIFENGGTSDKLLVLLGARPNKDMIAVLTTSRPPPRHLEPGCHAKEGYYVIPGGEKDWFREDTYVQLYRPVLISAPSAVKLGLEGKLRVNANLRPELAAAIRNCLKQSGDLPAAMKELLE